MADYRLECCGGYPGHNLGCPGIERGREIERQQKARKEQQIAAWTKFFDGMTDEEVFEYITEAEVEIAKVDRWKKRHAAAMDYIRREKLYRGNSHFLDRLRAWQKEYYGKHR